MICTNVLSEGQNLQDSHIVVNYDLPWAIIRLIQRAGRVDRIGQESPEILCYSFLPAPGIEEYINLRKRMGQRLRENQEVVGTDESFFEEDENAADRVRDIYSEKAGALDQADDGEIDLSSYALQIWKDAIGRDPLLESRIEQMPNVVFSAKRHDPAEGEPTGSLVYLRNAQEEGVMAWVDEDGNTVSESQLDILRSAACDPGTPAAPRGDGDHERVSTAAQRLRDQQVARVQLGSHLGARHKVYNRMKEYAEHEKGTIMVNDEFNAAIQDIYTYTLQEPVKKQLNRQLRLQIEDESLIDLVLRMRREGRLSVIVDDEKQSTEPRIICSMGLAGEAR